MIPGSRYGRLVALHPSGKRGYRTLWMFRCDCGTEVSIIPKSVRRGLTKSCGCLKSDLARERMTTHGMTGSAEFDIWRAIKARCYNANHGKFSRYGGRGISVCTRWKNSFANFFADMGRRPTPSHSVHRVNNDAGYSPKNCVWATATEQARNKSNSLHITYCGETLTPVQWASRIGISAATIRERLAEGLSTDIVLGPRRKTRT